MPFFPGGKSTQLTVLVLAIAGIALFLVISTFPRPSRSSAPGSIPSSSRRASSTGESAASGSAATGSPSRTSRKPTPVEAALLDSLASIPPPPPGSSHGSGADPFAEEQDLNQDPYKEFRDMALFALIDHYAGENPAAGIRWILETMEGENRSFLLGGLSYEIASQAPDTWLSSLSLIPGSEPGLRSTYLSHLNMLGRSHPRNALEILQSHRSEVPPMTQIRLFRSLAEHHPDTGFAVIRELGSPADLVNFFSSSDHLIPENAVTLLASIPDPNTRRDCLLAFAGSTHEGLNPWEYGEFSHADIKGSALRDQAFTVIVGQLIEMGEQPAAAKVISRVKAPDIRASLLQKIPASNH